LWYNFDMSDLDFVVEAIKKTLKPEKIILFGSYARGDNKESSDFDLAVLQKNEPKLGQVADVLTNLYMNGYTWKVSPDIHLFSLNNFQERLNNNSLFIKEIVRGKVIYEN